MTDNEQEKGENSQVQESHQKFLIKPEGLREVSKAVVVQGEKTSELNSIKSQTPRKKESDSEESKAALGNNFRDRRWTHKVLAKKQECKKEEVKMKGSGLNRRILRIQWTQNLNESYTPYSINFGNRTEQK